MIRVTRTLSPRRSASLISRRVWATIIRTSGAALEGLGRASATGFDLGGAGTRGRRCRAGAVAGQAQEHLFERLPADPELGEEGAVLSQPGGQCRDRRR